MYRETLLGGQPPACAAATFSICFLWAASLGVLFGLSANAMAAPLQPFRSPNLNPFLMGAGLPPVETPFLVDGRTDAAYLQLDVINNSVAREQDGEAVIVDGETYRTVLGLRRRVAKRAELGIDIPWIAHSPGFLDNLIEGWHRFFGLSNSERDMLGRGRLRYLYTRGSAVLAEVDQRDAGLGDVQLMAAWQFLESPDSAVTLRATVDLATGDAEDLTGSDGTEAAVAVAFGDRTFLALPSMSAMANAGVLYTGSGTVLEAQQKDWVGFGGVFVGWAIGARLALKAQLDLHTPVFATALRPLGAAGIQLTVGGQATLSDRVCLDLGIGENLHTGATPDVVFHFALTYRDW